MRGQPARLGGISLDFAGIPPRIDENFPYNHVQVGQPGKVGLCGSFRRAALFVNYIISASVNIGGSVNIGCDTCFYIAFNNTLSVVKEFYFKEVLWKNERMLKHFECLLKWNTGNTETSKRKK